MGRAKAGKAEEYWTSKELDGEVVPYVPAPEPVMKHPLQDKWAMWYFKNDRSKDWAANLKMVLAFDTVEDFWGLFNHLVAVSRLPSGCDYSLFKDGIQPMWEDARNKEGGRWLLNLDKSQRLTVLDDFWKETLMCLIGNTFEEHSGKICGATVNIRNRGDKLGIWTADAKDKQANLIIGKGIKERLNVPSKTCIGYQSHADAASKSTSVSRNLYTV